MVLLAEYNITMNQLNSSGTYDTLYPSSIAPQITQITSASDYGLTASSSVDSILSLLKNSLQVNPVPHTYGSLSVGDTVSLNVNGTAYDWIVVQQGVPSSMYDNSCNGTWLMMKDCYSNSQWYTGQNLNDYGTSYINTYLNTTFFNLLDSEVQSQISQVKIPYLNGSGSSGSIYSGTNGLTCKVFLLGGYELGWTSGTSVGSIAQDGNVLSYFQNTSLTDSKRIARRNNSAVTWWTRTPLIGNDTYVLAVTTTGAPSTGYISSNSLGMRPVIIMPSTASYSTSYTFTHPNGTNINNIFTQIETGNYIGNGTYGSNNPNSLTFEFTPKIWGITIVGTIATSVNQYFTWGTPVDRLSAFNMYYTYSGNTVSWYSSQNATDQNNVASTPYYYFALG